MTDGNSSNANNGTGIEVALLEKRLEGLRDTQESVQGLSLWCQANKKHSTPIIDTWLRILRKSPVEKRLTMFYLANDVVQHAKKKGDVTVVNQWAVAVQKATPHVRSPSSVSTAIVRIFKIWEERGIYSKDTVADLIALVTKHNPTSKELVPESKKKPEIYTASDEKVKGFQGSSLSSTIKQAFKLKSHLGVTFRTKQYVNMNMEQLIASIKDRQHGVSVIENMGELLELCKISQNKLVHEVEERRRIVEAAEVAIVFYENVRSDAGIVSNAYKKFTEQVIKAKTKVDEMIRAFAEMEGSPMPSPDRLSPYDEVTVVLPSLAEFEARQAQASNLIQVIQSNSSANSTSPANEVSTGFNSSSTDSSGNRMQQGMLASGSAYDLMSASQWPNYAMQLQMMQQQMAQAYAYQTDHTTNKPPPAPEIGSIPLPPPTDSAPPPPSNNSGQQQRSSQPVPPQESPANTQDSAPYDPMSVQYTPTSSQGDYGSSNPEYGNDEYEPESYEPNPYSYDGGDGGEESISEEYMESHHNYNSIQIPPSTTTRFHPYNNSTPPALRRGRGRGSTPRIRPPRFSSSPQGPSPGFRNGPPPFNPRNPNTLPIPFNPRNPNTTPILRRGGPRFSSYSQSHPRAAANTTSNLLRLAQYEVDQQPPATSQQELTYPYQPVTTNYPNEEGGDERLNGNAVAEFQGYEKPGLLHPSPRTPLALRGVRGFKSPLRGSGRGGFGVGSVGFRGGRGRGGPSPRRGSYFIL